jgi:hypothetical protein
VATDVLLLESVINVSAVGLVSNVTVPVDVPPASISPGANVSDATVAELTKKPVAIAAKPSRE